MTDIERDFIIYYDGKVRMGAELEDDQTSEVSETSEV
jgi:galactokinase/mevalonate kinase-like predicted kinase